MILDTSFVIAAEREAKRGVMGAADEFLGAHTARSFFITFTIAGELACGQSAAAFESWKQLCQPFAILPWTREVSWRYGAIYRQLQARGNLIGANDLWIAATAVVHGMPVVTSNVAEFQRVEGLAVVGF